VIATPTPVATPPPEVGGPSGDFSSILDLIPIIGGILSGILGGGGSSDVTKLATYVNQLGTEIVNGLDLVGGALELLFGTIIPEFLKRLLDALRALASLIADALGKLAKIIQWLRDLHDWLFRRFIFPVLNAIGHIRQMLLLLRLLHVKWAQKLDATLADIEGKIALNFGRVWFYTLNLLSWAQLITGADGLFRGGVLWGSLARDLDALRTLTGAGAAMPLTPDQQTAVDADAHFFDPDQVAARQALWHAGVIPPPIAAVAASIRET